MKKSAYYSQILDGVVNIQLQEILAQGSGSIHGTDASPAMIEAAIQAASKVNASKCTFEGEFSLSNFYESMMSSHNISHIRLLDRIQLNKCHTVYRILLCRCEIE